METRKLLGTFRGYNLRNLLGQRSVIPAEAVAEEDTIAALKTLDSKTFWEVWAVYGDDGGIVGFAMNLATDASPSIDKVRAVTSHTTA